MAKILVVEDDATLRRVVCDVLRNNGHQSIPAGNGEEALGVLESAHVDLMISDIMMPEMDGYELTKTLRDAGYSLPILMITAREQYRDIERGFGVGTDDYMIKPINMDEMLLRVKALLRRAKIFTDRKIVSGATQVDYDAMTVSNGELSLTLPQKEFLLLFKLLSYPDKIMTRQQLMDEIWGYDSETDAHTIDVHIARLRDRLKSFPDLEIQTIRGLGYKAVKRDEQ